MPCQLASLPAQSCVRNAHLQYRRQLEEKTADGQTSLAGRVSCCFSKFQNFFEKSLKKKEGKGKELENLNIAFPASGLGPVSKSLVSKVIEAVFLPFTFITGIVSLFFIGSSVADLKKAHHYKDKESKRSHSLDVIAGSANLANSSLSAADGVLKMQAATGLAVAQNASKLFPAVAGASLVAFAIDIVIQSISFARIKQALGRIMTIFEPLTDAEKEKKDFEKYQIAMDELTSYVGLTVEEERLIQSKTGDYAYGDAFSEEVSRWMMNKRCKLERRVGSETARYIEENAQRLSNELKSHNIDDRKKALLESEALFKKYKGSLYKKMALSLLGISAGVLGCIASAVALASPIGAMAISTVFLISAIGVFVLAIVGEKKWDEKDFEQGLKFRGRVLSNFEIPDAKALCKVEELKVRKITRSQRSTFKQTIDLSSIYALHNLIKVSCKKLKVPI